MDSPCFVVHYLVSGFKSTVGKERELVVLL